jgi:hypothetical protein
VEPLFLPLILFGPFALAYMLVRPCVWLLQVRRTPRTAAATNDDASRRSLAKLLSSLLLWAGLLVLDCLALAYVFVQGDEERVLPGWLAAAMALAGGGRTVVAVWLRYGCTGLGPWGGLAASSRSRLAISGSTRAQGEAERHQRGPAPLRGQDRDTSSG